MKSSDIACTAKFAHLAGIYPKRAQAEKEADAKKLKRAEDEEDEKSAEDEEEEKEAEDEDAAEEAPKEEKKSQKAKRAKVEDEEEDAEDAPDEKKDSRKAKRAKADEGKKKTPKRAGADWNARGRRRSLQVQRRASVRRLPRNWRFRRAFRATRRLRYWPPLPRARRAAARIWRSGWRRFPARTSGWKALNPTVRAHSRRTFWLRAEKRAANAYPLNRSKDDNVNDGRQSPTARHLERSLYSRSTDRRHAATGHRNDYACRRPITARRAVGPQRGWRLCVVQKDGEGWFAATGGDSGGRGRRAQYPRLGGRVSDGRV